ncbi:MAG: ARPP-1 family domain-containing protein [Pirellulales bacterium]
MSTASKSGDRGPTPRRSSEHGDASPERAEQPHTIGTHFVVPAGSGRIPLPAHRVEQSRWLRRSSEPVAHFSASKEFVSSKKARLAVQFLKNQGEVWKSVAEEQQSLALALNDEVRSAE